MTVTAVITVARGRHGHLHQQHLGLQSSTVAPDHYFVVAMGDPELAGWDPGGTVRPTLRTLELDDGRLPLAAARNLGARTALAAGADVLIFLDVDCIPAPDLVATYRSAAEHPETRDDLLCGPVAYLPPAPAQGYDLSRLSDLAPPHPARPAPPAGQVVTDHEGHQLFWSLSFAVSRRTWSTIGGFDEAYVGYGGEDTDFAQRAAARDIPVSWVGGALSHHQHHPVSSPPVEHLDDIVRNAAIFHQRWGWWPMQGWLDDFERSGLAQRHPDGSWTRVTSADVPSAEAGLQAPRDVHQQGTAIDRAHD
ncbi:glycosyltransferase family 2 protein [Aeromicrobium sp. UC242_57]|uniref:glycosyltransferase family 2 protein n=1 Tax=Aeromicrobium sp. UC242_57 TaxID=3374624 RepID=UPI0037AAE1D8